MLLYRLLNTCGKLATAIELESSTFVNYNIECILRMKKLLILLLFGVNLSGNIFASFKLHNDYSYLQEITLELYTDDIPAYNVPKQMKSMEEILMYDVMHATWKEDHWVAYTLNKNLLGTYKVGQPALLDNGTTKKIFFIANFNGTKGGLDIYSADFSNGKWSKPQNLGTSVNTINNETNPGLLNENTLTYSSKGIIKKLDLKSFKVVDLMDNSLSTSTKNKNDEIAAIGDNSSAKPIEPKADDYGAIGDNSSAAPAMESKKVEQIMVKEKASAPKETNMIATTVAPISKVENLGSQTRADMLNKYKTAIQLGAFSVPKWDLIQPLSQFGKIVTYKNENGTNVIWLTGFANHAAAEKVLPQIKATPGFENAYITGK